MPMSKPGTAHHRLEHGRCPPCGIKHLSPWLIPRSFPRHLVFRIPRIRPFLNRAATARPTRSRTTRTLFQIWRRSGAGTFVPAPDLAARIFAKSWHVNIVSSRARTLASPPLLLTSSWPLVEVSSAHPAAVFRPPDRWCEVPPCRIDSTRRRPGTVVPSTRTDQCKRRDRRCWMIAKNRIGRRNVRNGVRLARPRHVSPLGRPIPTSTPPSTTATLLGPTNEHTGRELNHNTVIHDPHDDE